MCHVKSMKNYIKYLVSTLHEEYYLQTLKMETVCSFEMSVNFQPTTQHYIPGDSTLHNHCHENLKSYTFHEAIHKTCQFFEEEESVNVYFGEWKDKLDGPSFGQLCLIRFSDRHLTISMLSQFKKQLLSFVYIVSWNFTISFAEKSRDHLET
jgi:hypothetical protein